MSTGETVKEAARRLSQAAIRDGYKPEALHAYTDEQGNPLHWRIRLKHPDTADKWIRPMKLNSVGYTLGEPDYPGGKPLYGLHQLASRPNDPVFLVEGEWCADALAKVGLLATTSGAADSASKADWGPLAQRKVIIWPDNDEAGQRYAREAAHRLRELECDVGLVDVEPLGLPPKGDAIDWLGAHPAVGVNEVLDLPTIASTSNGCAPTDRSSVVYRRLSEVTAKPIRWLWHGRIARGKVSMLAGNPGLGKSQVTASLAAVVTTGSRWPVDRTKCDQGSVIILSAEDDAEDTIRPRLQAAGADLARVFILDAVKDWDDEGQEQRRSFNLKTDLARLEEMLAEVGDVALIVIDPVTAYLGGTDSHKNADIRALLAPLSDAAARHGAAVVCVSHLNKGSNSEVLMRVMGSLAFVAAARAAFVVVKDQEDETRRLFLPIKNNIGNDQSGLAFRIEQASVPGDIETSRVAWESDAVSIRADDAMASSGDSEERSALQEAKDFLTELLFDSPMAAKKVFAQAKEAGIADRTVRRAKDALGIKPTKMRFDGGWEWALPTKVANECEDVHSESVDTFGDLGHLGEASRPDSDEPDADWEVL